MINKNYWWAVRRTCRNSANLYKHNWPYFEGHSHHTRGLPCQPTLLWTFAVQRSNASVVLTFSLLAVWQVQSSVAFLNSFQWSPHLWLDQETVVWVTNQPIQVSGILSEAEKQSVWLILLTPQMCLPRWNRSCMKEDLMSGSCRRYPKFSTIAEVWLTVSWALSLL